MSKKGDAAFEEAHDWIHKHAGEDMGHRAFQAVSALLEWAYDHMDDHEPECVKKDKK